MEKRKEGVEKHVKEKERRRARLESSERKSKAAWESESFCRIS
jgi:hypothetical protein